MTNTKALLTGVAPFALGLALISTPAYAQPRDPDQQEGVSGVPSPDTSEEEAFEDSQGDSIIVTGTRIQRPDLENVSPVTVVGAADIANTGTTRTEDLLNSLPQVFASQNAFIVNGGTGTATVDLRGLGAIRTLVLVDGRRLQPGDPFAVVADINQIPSSLIERVDIVTGGASSVYGADAVAGVVNFVMDRDFEGVRADAQVSFYQHDNRNNEIQDLLDSRGFLSPKGSPIDGIGYDANLVIGAGFDDGRGHVTAYVGYRQIDELTQAARDYSACSLAFNSANPSGYSCSGSGTNVPGTFLFFGGSEDLAEGDPNPAEVPIGSQFQVDEETGGFRPFTAADAFNFNPQNFFQRPDKRYVGGFFAEYEISPSVVPYAEFMFMDDVSDAQIASSGTFYGNAAIPCDNAFISDIQFDELGCNSDDELLYLYNGKRLIEAGPRNSQLRHTAYRIVAGVRGEISENWSYDAYAQRGTTIFSQYQTNDVSLDRVNQALDTVVDPVTGAITCSDTSNGCIPLNLFEPGAVTPEAADFITIPGIIEGETTQYVVSGFITGTLGSLFGDADPIGVVIGSEYRKEIYGVFPDDVNERGALAGLGGPTATVEGQFSVREVFAEINAPLFEFANGGGVVLEAGYRYSDYTTTGGSHTYKGGATIEPFPGIRFRGVYNRAERAPNVVELFSPQQIALFGGVDPCAGPTPEASEAACANTGVLPGQYGFIAANPADQYNQLVGGNLDLDPEKADTYTGGVVIDGGQFGINGLSATVDYFRIDIDGAISGIGAQTTLDTCLDTGDPAFCDLINRGPGGSLFLGDNSFIVNTQQNIGGIRTTGIDFNAGYRLPLGPGQVFANITGTYLIDYEFQTLPTTGFYDCAGFYGTNCGTPNPEYRHRVSFGYTSDAGWGLTGRWRYFGEVDIDQSSSDPDLPGADGTFPGTVDDQLSDRHWFDVSASYDFTENFQMQAGVNNIFDKEPPTIGGAFGPSNGNTFTGQYDPVGRYIYVGGQIQF